MIESFESREILEKLQFCVIDLETTGGNLNFDEIIEIGLVKIENLQIVDEMHFLLSPRIPVPEFILKLTSLNLEDLAKGHFIEQVIDEITSFIGSSILVAHNTSFDIPFLNSVFVRLGRDSLANKHLCTQIMTKHLIPEITTTNLGHMARLFKLPHDRAHRALEDANATAKLFLIFLNYFIEKGISKVNQLYYPLNKFEMDRIHFSNLEKVERIKDYFFKIKTDLIVTFKGANGVIISTIPINKPIDQWPIIEDFLQTLPWKSLSIRLMGHFFKSFLQFNLHFPKFEVSMQKKLIGILYEHVLQKNFNGTIDPSVNAKENFLIGHHLIPEQFNVYPLGNLNLKSHLILRYPAHQKKFLNYIATSLKKGKKNPTTVPTDFVQKDLQEFFLLFLTQVKQGLHPSSVLFNGETILNRPKNLKDIFQKLKPNLPILHSYPCDYL